MISGEEHPIDVHAPSDAALPFQWLTGFALRELHRHDPALNQCTSCGSADRHCPYALLGWQVMRQALTDPESLPVMPPD